jgi:flagellar biosynthetic protein FliP
MLLTWLGFTSIATAVMAMWQDEIIVAVETRYYPAAKGHALGLGVELAMGGRAAIRVALINLLLLPAYLLSELTTAFTIGMYVMVPFLLIDLMVATLLMSMGMAMVPPTVVARPLKVAVFVMADGWTLVVRGLISSFGV